MKFVQGGHVGVFHPAFLALSFYRTIPSSSCFLAQPRTRDQHSGNVCLTSGSPQSHSSPSSTYLLPHFWPPKDCVTSGRLKRHIPMPFSRLASRSFLLQLLNTMGNGYLQGRARTSVARALKGLTHPSRAAVRGTHGRHLPGWPLLVSVNKGLSLWCQKMRCQKMRHLRLRPEVQSCRVPTPLMRKCFIQKAMTSGGFSNQQL